MAQINKSSEYFNTVLYTGNGTGQDITTLDFQPDWLWIKRRDSLGSHRIQDSIRGTTNYLQSDKTDTEASGGDVDAFLSNGFSLSGGATAYNVSGGTYVGWSWLGGGTASSNTDGSITSTVSANTTSGFSIVSYTGNDTAGATVGHGLGVKPAMIIFKALDWAGRWHTYHSTLGATKFIRLDLNSVADTATSFMNDTEPTSSVITLGSSGHVNDISRIIAYCFAEKKSFSKFGSYTGNNSNDGTFVYTGFKPAWVMVKRTDSTLVANWSMFDNKRSSYNIERSQLEANTSDAQQTDASADIDLLSNGFKLRSTADENNDGGATYIYMAFASEPLVGSNNVPATAR